mmetsp:Transcript_50643/g.89538  ORF Transcript_50643/g.89538 Transcript_50643/m.89538 type:complete len:113 (-) Transcript_50643:328-666(-)
MSPVHAHSDADTKVKSNCFLTVLKGELHETTFEPHEVSGDTVTSEGQTRALAAGVSGYINDDIGVHKVGNASNTIPAVSLHVYAPGWSKVPVYTEAPTDAGGAAMDAEWGDF